MIPITDATRAGEGRVSEQTVEQSALVKEYYFPTQIYFRDLAGAPALNARLRDHVYRYREHDRAGIVRSNLAELEAWHSAVDLHHRPELAELNTVVIETVQRIFDDLAYDPAYEPVFSTMWANINPRHAFNRTHTHPHALWSGVYYVQTPPGCGHLYFYDPRPQAQVMTPCHDPARDRPAESWSEVYFAPIEGRLVLFPAWLMHDVRPNLADDTGAGGDRISFSFNFHQKLRDGERDRTAPGHDGRGEVGRAQIDTTTGG